jgi:hypothetical protein
MAYMWTAHLEVADMQWQYWKNWAAGGRLVAFDQDADAKRNLPT